MHGRYLFCPCVCETPQRRPRPSPSLRLRRVASHEAPALRALQRLSMTEIAADHYSPEQIAAFLAVAGPGLDDLVEDGRGWVIAHGEDLVACAAWRRPPDSETAVARSVYVHPAWARRGLAGRLLQRLECDARADGCTMLSLHSMLGATAFYRSRGFRPVEDVILDMDGVPFPGVEMIKTLGRSLEAE